MYDGRCTFDGCRHLRNVGNVALNKLEIRIPPEFAQGVITIHQLIEDTNPLASLQQQVYSVRADIAGPADDQDRTAGVSGQPPQAPVSAVRQPQEDPGHEDRYA